MEAPRRSLYDFDADRAPSTYITNYLITAVCVIGLIIHRVFPPAPRAVPPSASAYARVPPTLLIEVHLWLFSIVMLLGGLGHQVWYHNRCPGTVMPANVTVPCPAGTDNEPVISAYLFFLGPSELQLLPMAVALSGLAGKCAGAYVPIVGVSQLLGLGLGVLGAVLGHGGFLILGATLLLLYLAVAVMSAIGLCVEPGHLVAGRVLLIVGGLLAVVGGVVQVLLTGACGSTAYMADGAAGCPFGGDGVTGLNHNFVYHVFEIASKLALVAALRFLVVTEDAKGGTSAPTGTQLTTHNDA